MANFTTRGLEEIIGSFEELAKLPDDVILDMLTAEAEVIAEEQKAAFSTACSKGYSKGITEQSVTFSKKLKKSKDGKAIYVYPKGTRSDSPRGTSGGTPRRTAEVAYINEYGASKRGIPKRLTIRTANAKATAAAEEAAKSVYEKYLKSKNL